MNDELLIQYFEAVKNTEEFIKFNRFTCLLKDMKNKPFEQFKTNLIELLKVYLPGYSEEQINAYFVLFFENYRKKTKPNISLSEDGFVDLEKTLFFPCSELCGNKGHFSQGWLILPDGKLYLCKYPLDADPDMDIKDKTCIYIPTMATGIAKALNVTVSENIIAKHTYGGLRILSENFVDREKGETLTTFYYSNMSYASNSISGVLAILEEELSVRNYPSEQIADAKLEFLKQEFVAKLIGLKDQKSENTGIIISEDENGNKNVRLAPMFDLDISFDISDSLLCVRRADNGRGFIGDLIKQYKDDQKFMEFVRASLDTLDMEAVFQNIYESTGIKFFKEEKSKPKLKRYSDYVEENVMLARKALEEIDNEKNKEEK